MRYRQLRDADCEAGGLLLGSVHGCHMLITDATVPTRFDKRFRFFFERMESVHRLVASTMWRQSKGLIRYLGEWHTHPQDQPSPSGTDILEWRDLAKKRRDFRPMLAVIVGRDGMHVELMFADGGRMRLEAIS
nr:Mov34/MPN/PAD-1 family protein [Lysobacter enzymogenes]